MLNIGIRYILNRVEPDNGKKAGIPSPLTPREGVLIKSLMALNANLDNAIRLRPGNTQQYKPGLRLTLVERRALGLTDLTGDQPGGASDAPAIAAAHRQNHALRLTGIENGFIPGHINHPAVPVPECDLIRFATAQSQMSDVQSPPG